MDAVLREGLSAGASPASIAKTLFQNGMGRRSEAAVRARAERLELTPPPAICEVRVDCRATDGEDPLVSALRAIHKAPPPNIRPHPFDGVRFDWRAVMPVGGCAGSPAALCAE